MKKSVGLSHPLPPDLETGRPFAVHKPPVGMPRKPTNERTHSMSYDFNADEVFEMAEQLERNGNAFYLKAAESVKDPGHVSLLRKLAATSSPLTIR